MGFLDRLKAGLAKTAKVLSTDVRDLFKREGRLVDDDFLEELRAALVKTDMGPAAAEAIVADVGERLRARVVEPGGGARLDPHQAPRAAAAGRGGPGRGGRAGPTVILVTGVNGSGKTTSIAKLARLFTRARQDGRARRRRHLSGGRRRTAGDVGRPGGSGDRPGRDRLRSGQRGPPGRGPGPGREASTSASSIRPAGSRPSRT